MIIQFLLDGLSEFLGGVVALLPGFPAEWLAGLNKLASAGTWISGKIGVLGVIIPFIQLGAAITTWVSIVGGFWVSLVVVRGVLWAFNR